MPEIQYSFTDDSALWQARYGNKESAATEAAWGYIETRIKGWDRQTANERVNARIDDEEDGESEVFPDQNDYASS